MLELDKYEAASNGLHNARQALQDAGDALSGLTNAEWRGVQLSAEHAGNLRSLLGVVRERADAIGRWLS